MKRLMAAWVSICMLTACAWGQAPASTAKELHGISQRAVRSGEFAGRPYLLRIPEHYRAGDALPLVIYLSGGPGRASVAVSTGDAEISRWGVFAVYPDAGGQMWWEPQSAAMVDAIVREVIEEFQIDRRRVYLAGFSNGATGALYYATMWPRRFAGLWLLMGAGNCMAKERGWKLKALAGVPVLLVHGDKDRIIPLSCSERAEKSLRKAGAVVEFHVLKDRGHDITLNRDDGFSSAFWNRLNGAKAEGTAK